MKYTVTGKGKYLLVPVWAGQKEKNVSLCIDDGKEIFLRLPLCSLDSTQKEPSFFASIPLLSKSSMQSAESNALNSTLSIAFHTLLLTVDEDLEEGILSLFSFTDVVPHVKTLGKRPCIHFTANAGWINDPNGMVYKDGVYHLYFQYNPFNTQWENMCWGYAVSSDLLHWEQKDTVLFPNKEAHIFSGSGIVNSHSLLNLNKDALIFFYTYATPRGKEERAFTQKIAYSTDNGTSFSLIEGDCIPTLSLARKKYILHFT